MVIVGLVLAALAALLHIYIFYMESMAWTSEKVRTTFGMTESESEATKTMAFNQGFYNLFLALAVIVGLIFFVVGSVTIGITLIFTGTVSMFAAALVLLLSSPDKRITAVKQGLFPFLAVIVLAIGIAI